MLPPMLMKKEKKLGYPLTWVGEPLLERLLEAPHVQGLGRHADERHDLQELFLAGVAQLLDVVSS